MKSKKNRNDFVLILVLLAVILIGFLVVRLQRQKDAFTVDVSVNGTTVATYRLDAVSYTHLTLPTIVHV